MDTSWDDNPMNITASNTSTEYFMMNTNAVSLWMMWLILVEGNFASSTFQPVPSFQVFDVLTLGGGGGGEGTLYIDKCMYTRRL